MEGSTISTIHGIPNGIEGVFSIAVNWTKLGLEIISAFVVLIAACLAIYQLGRMLISPNPMRYYQRLRLEFSRSLVLALEFQLAADIIGTTVAPTWEQLGKLGAIALIRTFLNYFLAREIKEIELESDEVKQKDMKEKRAQAKTPTDVQAGISTDAPRREEEKHE
jgi:uncharacterized membrane protein